jgi:outer membrane lipoprotein-sorting protein
MATHTPIEYSGYVRFFIAICLVPAMLGQNTPSAGELLQKVADAYSNQSQIRFNVESTKTLRRRSGDPPINPEILTLEVAMDGEGNLRIDGFDLGGPRVMVANRRTVSAYFPDSNAYMVLSRDSDVGKRIMENVRGLMHQQLEAFKVLDASRATVIGQEQIHADGRDAECYVVQIRGKPDATATTTWWIDKAKYIVLREDEETDTTLTTEVYVKVSLGETLAESLFTFTPPPGAKLMPPPR